MLNLYLKRLFLIFSFSLCINYVKAQSKGTSQINNIVEPQDFKNQGEQEEYWAKQLFKEYYKVRFYKRFEGKISIDGSNYRFDDQVLSVHNTDSILKRIFEKGIFYPQIRNGYRNSPIKTQAELDAMTDNEKFFYNLSRADTMTISNFEEIKSLRNGNECRRFRFLLFRNGFANPIVHFLELTNGKARSKTTIRKFIDGADVTFFKEGWIQI